MRRARLVLVAASACLLPRAAIAAPPAIVVVPWQPSVDTASAEQAATRAGLRVIAFDAIRRDLEAADAARRDAETATLRRADDMLAAAQQAFLDQRFTDMIAVLDPLDDAALIVLGRPEHRALLWDAMFHRGLASLMRHAAGDLDRARDRFLLALAISPERRPARDVYGPDVERAFADAVAERDRRATHGVAIVGAPPDARLLVDGTPVLDLSRRVLLRAGPHVVLASAIGFATSAWIADVRGDSLSISLVPDRAASAATALGTPWARGELADAPSTSDTVLQLAAAQHADAVLLVDRTGDQHARARVLAASGVGAWERRDTTDAAVAAALAWLAPDGRVVAPVDAMIAAPPLWHRPWVWASAAAAIGFVVVAIVLTRGGTDDRLHVVAQ